MTGLNAVYNLALADFLERIRRFSFLVVLGMTALAGYSMVPSAGASYNGFVMAGCRGVYNSPWIGTIVGITVVSLLSLIGFYLVKDSVARDYDTRVGQIVAATPVSRLEYVAGKWLSNLAVLSSILLVLTLVAVIMRLVRGEVPSLDLPGLIAPIWLISLPVLAWVAAFAVLFETIPLLRGSFGYVIFMALWMWMLLVVSVLPMFVKPGEITPHNDFMGISTSISDMARSMTEQGFDMSKGTTDIGQPTEGHTVEHFMWKGVRWWPGPAFGRLLWLAGSCAVVILSAIPFDRFDPARQGRRGKRSEAKHPRGKRGGIFAWRRRIPISGAGTNNAQSGEDGPMERSILYGKITPPAVSTRGNLRTIAIFELRLLLAGRNRWWYLGALLSIVLSGALTSEGMRALFLAIAWFWPATAWSLMGSRETHFRSSAIVFSAARPVKTQLPAVWLAGALLALIMGAGQILRLVITGNPAQVFGLAAGAAFVSALALALGVVTNGSRAFQIVYPILCYIGLSGRFIWFDYKGINVESMAAGIPLLYLAMAAGLLVLAAKGRARQVRGI
ncbi:MAG: ABC transporter permease [Candidatus Krumholzibacteria bacterium]|jgi:ABC-type transport system involved in multi-copper enzyme maturation permease subunit|nr:ABC transporter permease [Candidatus Krumholzibacteria bacterium]